MVAATFRLRSRAKATKILFLVLNSELLER